MPESLPVNGDLASTTATGDEVFAGLVAEITERLEAGESVDVETYVRSYPEHETRLRRLLPAMRALLDLGISTSPGSGSAEPLAAAAAPVTGTLGDFRLFGEIGRGGMGVVYEAEQISLGRRVALKVLPFAAVLDKRQLERFQNEARAAASLDHPGIVAVHSVGCERGVHYYAMQLIEGQTIAQLISQLRRLAGGDRDGESLDARSQLASDLASGSLFASRSATDIATGSVDPTAPLATDQPPPQVSASAETERPRETSLASGGSVRSAEFFRSVADLGIQAANALDHAHQRGVVHRDVKPSNLLIDRQGHLWLTDFGLARIESNVSMTLSGDLLGTLRYMSPEQALAKRAVVDHRTDIYSLGITLYELLTLLPAYGGSDRQQLLNAIASEQPRPPRQINPAIPADLETIVLQAIRKEPEDRYATAEDLANDLKRFVDGKPIHARRPTLLERAAKWSRRHIGIVATATILSLLAAIGSAASVALIRAAYQQEATQRTRAEENLATAKTASKRAETARQVADARAAELKTQSDAMGRYLYAAHVKLAQAAWQEGDVTYAIQLLTQHKPSADHEDLRSFDWYYLWAQFHPDCLTLRGNDYAFAATYSPDGSRVVVAFGDGKVRVWNATTGALLAELNQVRKVWSVAVSPDGKQIASGDADGVIKLWNVADWSEQKTLKMTARVVHSLAFSPDGRTLAATGSTNFDNMIGPGEIRLWDLESGTSRTLDDLAQTGPHGQFVHSLAFSPDGKTLAATTAEARQIKLWDLATGEVRREFALRERAWSVVFSPDGSRLAAGGEQGARLWDVSTGKLQVELPGQFFTLAFSPDGRTLAGGGRDGAVRLWDAANGRRVQTLHGHVDWIWSVAFSPDGTHLVSASRAGTVKVWPLGKLGPATLTASSNPWSNLGPNTQYLAPLAFSPHDANLLAIGGPNHTIQLRNVATGAQVGTLVGQTSGINAVAFSPNGKLLATASGGIDEPGSARLWKLTSKTEPPRTSTATDSVGWALLPVSVSVASKPPAKATDKPAGKLTGKSAHPTNGTITGTPAVPLDASHGVFSSVAFSLDGKLLAAGEGKTVRLWDTATGQLKKTLKGHVGEVASVAFTPDGRTLAAATLEGRSTPDDGSPGEIQSGVVRLWDVATGQLRHELPRSMRDRCVAFSPDGKRLAAATWNEFAAARGGHAAVWDAATAELKLLATIRGHRLGSLAVAFSPDGRLLATAGEGGIVRLTDTVNWSERLTLKWDEQTIVSLAFSCDGSSLAAASADGVVRLWHADLHPKFTEVNREAAAAAFERGIYWYQQGDYQQALANFKTTIELGPERDIGQYNCGCAYWQTGDFRRAIACFNKAIEISPSYAEAYHNRGVAYLDLDDYDRALADFTELIRLQPSNCGAYRLRADTYSLKGDFEKATRDYEQAIKCYGDVPAAAIALNQFAWFLANCRDPKWRDPARAVRLAEKAVEVAPEEANIWGTLGVARYRAGQWRAALDALEKSLGPKSDDFNPMGDTITSPLILAMAHWQLGEKDKARQWYAKAIAQLDQKKPPGAGAERSDRDQLEQFRREAAALLGIANAAEVEGKPAPDEIEHMNNP